MVDDSRSSDRCRAPHAAGRRFEVSATIPPLPGNSLVRYWFSIDGESRRVPGTAAAYFLSSKPIASPIPVYQLTIDSRSWDAIHRDARSNQTYAATLVADEHAYPVSVRCRGAYARSWRKKCYKFFLENEDGFQGQSRLNLNSAWQDVGYVRESLAYSVYEDLGVPASKTKFVRLDVNGEFWGLYVQVEQPDKAFLKKHGLEDAVLYKANSGDYKVSDQRELGSLEEYERFYEKETHKDKSHADLAEFCSELARARDVEAFFKAHVNLEQYVNYLCATALVQNWDCYNKNHFFARHPEDEEMDGNSVGPRPHARRSLARWLELLPALRPARHSQLSRRHRLEPDDGSLPYPLKTARALPRTAGRCADQDVYFREARQADRCHGQGNRHDRGRGH